MSCTNNKDLELVQVTQAKTVEIRANQDEKKGQVYDSFMIKNDMLTDLLNSTERSNTYTDLFGSADKAGKLPLSVRDKTRALSYGIQGQMPFGPIVGKIKDGAELRQVSIALHHLMSAKKSESDTADNNNIADRGLVEITDVDTGTINTSYYNMARVIGRDIMRSYGYRLVAKTRDGLQQAINKEVALGEQAIAVLQEKFKDKPGVLSITEKGAMANRYFRNEDGSMYKKTSRETPSILYDIKVIALGDIIPLGTASDDLNSFDITARLSAFNNLVLPSNKTEPSADIKPIDKAMQDMEMPKEGLGVVKQAQRSALTITPFFVEALEEVRNEVMKYAERSKMKTTLAGLVGYINDGNTNSKFLFGTIDAKELLEYANTDASTIEHIYGSNNANVVQIARLFDDWDTLKGQKQHYSYQVAVQNRLNVIESTLNYQSDKFLSRPILGSATEQIITSEQAQKYLIAHLSDELGFTPQQILGQVKDTKLEDHLALFNEDVKGGSPMSKLATIEAWINEGKSIIPAPKSAWEVANYVQAINDVREGIASGDGIKTHFMPKPDGTASGALITELQSIGRNEGALETFKQLSDGTLTDMYDLVVKPLEEELTGKQEDTQDRRIMAQRAQLAKVKEIADPNSKFSIVKGYRALAKLPYTKFIYGQSDKNNVLEISKEITQELIDSKDNNMIMHYLNIANPNLGSGALKDMGMVRQELIKYFSADNGAAKYLVQLVNDKVGSLFDNQAKSLGEIHTLLERARNADSEYVDINLIPPYAWINETNKGIDLTNEASYASARVDYSTNIDKWQESVLPSKDPGKLITIKKKFANQNSIKVLMQHMMDAGVLISSLETMFGKAKYKDYKEGLMLNHDAVGATVEFAMDLEPVYQETLMSMNANYDFIEAALAELKYAKSLLKDEIDHKLITDIDSKIKTIESTLSKEIQTKKKYLLGTNIDSSFGLSKDARDSVSNIDFNDVKSGKPVVAKVEPVDNTELHRAMKEGVIASIGKMKNIPMKNIAELALKINPSVSIVLTEGNGPFEYDLGSNTVYLGTKANPEKVVHELVHAATAQRLENDPEYVKQVQYLYDRALKASPEAMVEIEKLDEGDRLHEFMAAGITNSKMTENLKKVSVGQKILDGLTRFILKALGLKGDINNVYGHLLASFAESTYDDTKFNDSKVLSFTNVYKDAYRHHEPVNQDSDTTMFHTVADSVNVLDHKLAKGIDYTIDLAVDTIATKFGGKNQHDKLMASSPLYKNTINHINGVWNTNTLVGKLRIYLSLDQTKFDHTAMNKMETQSLFSTEDKMQYEEEALNRLHKLGKGLYEGKEKDALYSLLNESPVFFLQEGSDNILLDIMNGITTIDGSIEQVLKDSGLTQRAKDQVIKNAKEMAEMYINKKASSLLINTIPLDQTKASTITMNKLTALYSLQLVPKAEPILHKMMSTKKHVEYSQALLNIVMANKTVDNEIYDIVEVNSDIHSGNLNHMTFRDNIQTKIVNVSNVNELLVEKLGWKVLRAPMNNKSGIIYRDAGDMTYQSGVGVNFQTNPNIQPVMTKHQMQGSLASNNAVADTNSNNVRIVLTNEELTTLGIERSIDKSLVKAYSHKTMILETQAIREELVENFTYTYDPTLNNRIIKDIKDRTHLWYIKLPDDITIDQLPKEIRDQYKAARASSDVGGFKDKVTLVRADISDFIEGYGEIQIGETNTTLNKMFGILKKSILLQKIHWVIVNPKKILLDNVSNLSYLLSRNVPASYIYKSYREDAKLYHSLTKLREELVQAEFDNRAHSTTAKVDRVAKIEKELREHPLAAAFYNGFIQSIAIDLTGKNEHTAGGIHKDIGFFLDKVFKNDDGSLGRSGKLIMGLSKRGVNVEDLLVRIANKVGTSESSSIASTLNEIADHIGTIKKDGDISSYIQEFLATPGSSLVGVGSMLTQMTDFLSKNALMKYEIDRKSREWSKANSGKRVTSEALSKIQKDATENALVSFIDYKVNIPRELRFLEQTGVTSFISFWARIQRVIYQSIRQNPVNAMITIALNEYFNVSSVNILGSDIFNRFGGGNLIHTPDLGLDVLLPTKVIP